MEQPRRVMTEQELRGRLDAYQAITDEGYRDPAFRAALARNAELDRAERRGFRIYRTKSDRSNDGFVSQVARGGVEIVGSGLAWLVIAILVLAAVGMVLRAV